MAKRPFVPPSPRRGWWLIRLQHVLGKNPKICSYRSSLWGKQEAIEDAIMNYGRHHYLFDCYWVPERTAENSDLDRIP